MTKIANKNYCNSLSSGLFLGDLIAECPTYIEIKETDKFNINGTYEDNQLVKESDLSLYTGKTQNYCTAWGEWDQTHYSGTTTYGSDELWLKLHISFLFPPDVDLNIRFNYTIYYYSNGYPEDAPDGVGSALITTTGYTNLIYSASTQNYAISSGVFKKTYGNTLTGNPVFNSVKINSVTITPSSTTTIYNYIVDIKPIEQNYHKLLAADAYLSILSYTDDTANKRETCQGALVVTFSVPTGTTLTNNYNVGPSLDDRESTNFDGGQSVSTTTNYKQIIYKFNAFDNYGLRGYKLPYFKTKFFASGIYNLYFYAQWNPRVANTGIELTSLIAEE